MPGCLRDRLRSWVLDWDLGVDWPWPRQHPLGRRDCTPRPGPTARQRARPAEFWDGRTGLWRRPFGQARALAFQGPPSLLSTLHSPCIYVCGCPRSHSTVAASTGYSTHRRVGTPPHATQRGSYPHIRCVCPKRWLSLHSIGSFVATCVSTDISIPQSSVMDAPWTPQAPAPPIQ